MQSLHNKHTTVTQLTTLAFTLLYPQLVIKHLLYLGLLTESAKEIKKLYTFLMSGFYLRGMHSCSWYGIALSSSYEVLCHRQDNTQSQVSNNQNTKHVPKEVTEWSNKSTCLTDFLHSICNCNYKVIQ